MTNNLIAHRGAWKEFDLPQNSLAALKKAIQLNCFGVECDIHMTKDHILVVNHDDDYFGKLITSSTYKELAELQLKNGENFPLLADFLETVKTHNQTHLIIEVKVNENRAWSTTLSLIDKLVELMEAFPYPKLFSFITFDLKTALYLKQQLPAFKTSYLTGDISPQQVSKIGLDGIDYHFTRFIEHPDWIEHSKELQLITNTWTVNDPLVFKALQKQSIDHITTDYPNKFLKL